jgi:hypothetical protein
VPTLSIEGRNVQVDDNFLKLPADQQQATVDEIASHFAPVDPVSVNDVGRSFATGVPILGGLLNKADAATNAALAPVLNPLFDAKDQLQGDTFGDRYAKSLAMQEGADTKFATQHPYVDTGAKLAGASAALAPAVMAAPGLFGASGGLGSRVVMGGLSNAALGATDAAVRGGDPLSAAGFGGAVGAGVPVAGAIASTVASPFISNILARISPQSYATRQVARGIIESGRPTADIAGDVVSAANEGQGVYNVADAMGNAGQRMLSTVARAPGEGRTAVVSALEGRQGTQGRRVSNALAEGFDVPETAAQTEARLTGARDIAANAEYGAVRNDANQVDVTGTLNHLDRIIGTEPGQVLTPANDSIEAVLTPFRQRLSRVNPDDFAAVQRIRGDMSDAAEAARRGGLGNRARLIGAAVRQLDTAMENASEGHLAANRNFTQASRDIDAVQAGRQAATRGRTEDTIPAYENLSPQGQEAFRSGYVDPLIANTQGAAFGVNKARPLLNDAFQAEADAMAPGNPLMQRRIGREQTMFETRSQALGGSRTADNLADADALGIDPSVVGHIISGNWGGAVRAAIHAGSRAMTGNTPAVRAAVANILLQHGANVTPAALDQMVGATIARIQMVQQLAQGSARVAGGAVAVAPSARQKPSIFARGSK